MGAIFAVMKLNSIPKGIHYRESASAHPLHCPGQEGFRRPLRDEQEARGRSEGVSAGEEGGDQTINTRLMTSNTPLTQWKLTPRYKSHTPGAKKKFVRSYS